MKAERLSLTSLLSLVVMGLALVATQGLAADDLPLTMRANAGIQTGGRTSLVDISVTEWTTPEERQMLIDYMKSQGTLDIATKLQELSSKGKINIRGQIGIDWRYAYEFQKTGGRTIILGADRPVNVGEAIDRGATSRAHNVTLCVIEVDDKGRGAGTLIVGAELGFGADGRLEVTQAGQNPVHLGNVQILKSKKK